MIFTNRFHAEYNFENIDRDFDVFYVQNTSRLDHSNILDLATEQFKAKSVQYSFGKKALVLFEKKHISERDFREAVTAEHPEAVIKKLNVLDENDRSKHFYFQNRLLLLLLMNSIRVPRTKQFSYNNLTGKLYYGCPEWQDRDSKTKKPYGIYFLEVTFDPGMYLNLNVKSFRHPKDDERYSRYYMFDSKTGVFRRMLKGDSAKPDEIFVEASFKSFRHTIEFISFSGFRAFKKSKMGVMEQFLQDVRTYLGGYVTLTMQCRDNDIRYRIPRKERDSLTAGDYAEIINRFGLNIEDHCGTDKSGLFIGRLCAELQTFFGITPSIGPLQKNKYNIRLVHGKDYYEERSIDDPYKDDLSEYIVQHMDIEQQEILFDTMGKKASPVMIKVLTELIIKMDVHLGEIQIYDWKKLSSDKTWTFVTRAKIPLPENVSKNKCDYIYYAVKITPDREMEFFSFDDQDLPENYFEERVRSFYDTCDMKQRHANKYVEGLVFSDIENIHAVIRTCEKALPNTMAIQESLAATNGRDSLMKNVILEALDAFKDSSPEDAVYADRLKENIIGQSSEPIIKKKTLKTLMNLRSKSGKRFNRFLHNEYDIWVFAEMKNSDFSDIYMLENMTDIKYFVDENTDGTNILSFNYCVGPRKESLQFSIHNACIIRQVQAEYENEFKDLLPLMAVEFVRIGMYTVLPFPFKYIREYMNINRSVTP